MVVGIGWSKRIQFGMWECLSGTQLPMTNDPCTGKKSMFRKVRWDVRGYNDILNEYLNNVAGIFRRPAVKTITKQ